MADLRLAQSYQPWRVTVYFASVFAGQDDASRFTLRRTGTTRHPVTAAWTRSGSAVELALGEALLSGERYTLAHMDSAAVVEVAWYAPVTPPSPVPSSALDGEVPDDPEAEAFGIDIDWIGPGLTPSGDLPAERGIAVLRHDLAALAFTERGELVHRPAAGLGLRASVNRHATDATLEELGAEVSAAFLEDSRVRDAAVTLAREPATGRVLLRASVLTPPLAGDSIDFTTRL